MENGLSSAAMHETGPTVENGYLTGSYTFKHHHLVGDWWVYDPRGYLHAGPFKTRDSVQAEVDRLNDALHGRVA